MKRKTIQLVVASAMLVASSHSLATIVGWTTTGSSGVSTTTDGVVTIPSGFTSVDWISTYGGITGNNGGYGGTNGSTVSSDPFSVAAGGSQLSFNFDFITGDGSSMYPDYAWANLVNSSNTVVATLFTATTNPGGSTVPGTGAGLPPISATINPSTVTINTGPGSTDWSPIGPSSGGCFDGYGNGCGNTGWVSATYNIANAGDYYLVFGVANAGDQLVDTGLAFVGAEVGGTTIGNSNGNSVPEPASLALIGLGLATMARLRRRK